MATNKRGNTTGRRSNTGARRVMPGPKRGSSRRSWVKPDGRRKDDAKTKSEGKKPKPTPKKKAPVVKLKPKKLTQKQREAKLKGHLGKIIKGKFGKTQAKR